MKRATYKAFTLIEMLIVMGILVILMVVGVAAGRFAIDRANQIAHQNGATQLYQALQSHFTDYGRFPRILREYRRLRGKQFRYSGNHSRRRRRRLAGHYTTPKHIRHTTTQNP